VAKSRESKDNEFYLSQIRSLRAENKSLRKRLKQLEKNEHIYADFKLDDEEIDLEPEVKSKKSKCDQCGDGEIQELNIAGRLIYKCNSCSYRSKAIKIHEDK
jgi:tRNA(Ile2) C34 agmatinyltransferase TiaS